VKLVRQEGCNTWAVLVIWIGSVAGTVVWNAVMILERGRQMISREYMDEFCKIGQGKDCCVFLMVGPNGFECAKSTGLEATIRARIPHMTAQGDNCEGLNPKTNLVSLN
jgi:hypothetical protein